MSALLIAYLFFALGIEQRAHEAGLLAAVGFAPSRLRNHFLVEGAWILLVGLALGIAGAVGYAALIMYGLRTWWVAAVGTTALALHNHFAVYRVLPYLLLGVALWAALLGAGLHATLAGVLLALCIPTREPPNYRSLVGQADAHREAEAGPQTRRALDGDLAPHHLHEPARD